MATNTTLQPVRRPQAVPSDRFARESVASLTLSCAALAAAVTHRSICSARLLLRASCTGPSTRLTGSILTAFDAILGLEAGERETTRENFPVRSYHAQTGMSGRRCIHHKEESMTKSALLADLHREQEQWEALLAQIGETRMDQPGVAGEWSTK